MEELSRFVNNNRTIGGGGKALANLASGNFLLQYTDVSFPGRGLSVEIRRTYNSQTAFAGVFGPGWFSLLDTSVREADNKVVLLDAYGGIFEFTNPQSSGSNTVYTAPSRKEHHPLSTTALRAF